jgi:hypothetical protein
MPAYSSTTRVIRMTTHFEVDLKPHGLTAGQVASAAQTKVCGEHQCPPSATLIGQPEGSGTIAAGALSLAVDCHLRYETVTCS